MLNLDFDWCYAKSMLNYVIKQLSMSNYPYKSQFKSGADVKMDQYGFKFCLKSIDPSLILRDQ